MAIHKTKLVVLAGFLLLLPGLLMLGASTNAQKGAEEARAKELRAALTFAYSLAPSQKNSIGMDLILIKPGVFRMGGAMTGGSGPEDERPFHEVFIKNPFYMGKYEVTQAQWRAVMGNTPSSFRGDDLPAEMVSWNDAKSFCQKLSQMTGQEYRLPTEAEWEYACRADSTTAYSFGNDERQLGDYAWFGILSDSKTYPVGKKKPNPFGLYDVHGNVWEWCSDWYGKDYYAECQRQGVVADPQGPSTGKYRVMRGGSAHYDIRSTEWSGAYELRSANRDYNTPDRHHAFIGFRVVMSVKTP